MRHLSSFDEGRAEACDDAHELARTLLAVALLHALLIVDEHFAEECSDGNGNLHVALPDLQSARAPVSVRLQRIISEANSSALCRLLG